MHVPCHAVPYRALPCLAVVFLAASPRPGQASQPREYDRARLLRPSRVEFQRQQQQQKKQQQRQQRAIPSQRK